MIRSGRLKLFRQFRIRAFFCIQAICNRIRSTAEPILADYIGQYNIKAIEFKNLSLGNIPPTVHVLKSPRRMRELMMEPAVRWAGNPNIMVAVTISSVKVTIQVSLLEKPHIDFRVKVLGGDMMSIPGLYRYVQERIKEEVASLCLWPNLLTYRFLMHQRDSLVYWEHITVTRISILKVKCSSMLSRVPMKKPIGILHVRVIRATKLLKMDLLGLSDPYVKLNLSGEKHPSKKTMVESHDRLGTQVFALKTPALNEVKEVTLDLLKELSVSDVGKKQRGQLFLELTYAPFREDNDGFSRVLYGYSRKDSVMDRALSNISATSASGLLLVTVQGVQDVELSRHNNPYALIIFRGETKKLKVESDLSL
ncbi:hypothetical protein OROHE_010085 [Orobanche hederae]